MLFLDDTRIKFNRKTDYFKTYFKPLENTKWYCGYCDKIIHGEYDDLVYLGECDAVFHIHNIETGEMCPANKMINSRECNVNPCIKAPNIPKLSKLLKNIKIKSDGQISQIKARDNFKCQLCGFDDDRALEVHHIIPKISPFVSELFKRDPINCITLCANCHRIVQKTLNHGSDVERRDIVLKLGEINGWLLKWVNPVWYENLEKMRYYSKIKW
jgi:hypothetical protein